MSCHHVKKIDAGDTIVDITTEVTSWQPCDVSQ